MKGTLTFVLAFGLVVSANAAAVNLIPYPNFDTPTELVARSAAGNGLPIISWDATESTTGTAGSGALLLEVHGAAGTAGWIESGCISVTAGSYRVCVWTKTKSGQLGSGPADVIGLLVNYYDNSACTSNSLVGSVGMSYSMPTQWTQRHIDLIASPGTMGATVVVSIGKGPANGCALNTWLAG